jgi:hypothetical protein
MHDDGIFQIYDYAKRATRHSSRSAARETQNIELTTVCR